MSDELAAARSHIAPLRAACQRHPNAQQACDHQQLPSNAETAWSRRHVRNRIARSIGSYATIFLGPDRKPTVTADQVCTNHHEWVVWPEHGAISRTVEPLARQLAKPVLTLDQLVETSLEPPLYSRWIGSPTVYTAVYRPTERHADYLWPGKRWCQLIDQFGPGDYTHDYGDLEPSFDFRTAQG